MNNTNFYRNMLDNFYEGVYFVDCERKITFWNSGAEKITGFSAKEVLDSYCFDNILNHVDESGKKLCSEGCPLDKSIKDGQSRETMVYLHHKEGHRVKIFVRTRPIVEDDEIVGAVEVFVDDSEKVKLVSDLKELKMLAMYDQLTELPNRRYINSHLELEMKKYHNFNIPFGVAFIDIDHFKKFNDDYGHDMGDRVLQTLAKTFESVLRKGDLAGRWGGEEFIMIFSSIDIDGLRTVTEKIRMLVENSIIRKGKKNISVTVSIGATLINSDDDIDLVIKRADNLMYTSKKQGRNQVVVRK